MKRITVTERSGDFHAQLFGEPGKWGSGRNPYEAIGNLVNAWPREFGIEILNDYGQDSGHDKVSAPVCHEFHIYHDDWNCCEVHPPENCPE